MAGAALLPLILLLEEGRPLDIAWAVITSGAFVATLVGPRMYPSTDRTSGRLLATAIGGLTVSSLLAVVVGDAHPLAMVVVGLHVVGLFILGAAMFRLAAVRLPGGGTEARIDTTLVMVGTAAVLYELISVPALSGDPTEVMDAVFVVLPLFQAAVLAAAIRLLMTGAHRLAAAWSFLIATVTVLYSSIAFVTAGGSLATPLVRTSSLVVYVALACGVLHPSAARLGRPAEPSAARLTASRLAIIGAPLVALPIVMLRGGASDSPVPGLAALACVVLVLWRTGRLLRERERVSAVLAHRAEREGALSAIGRAAITAAGPEAFDDALVGAIDDAMGTTTTIVPVATAAADGHRRGDIVVPVGDGERVLLVRSPGRFVDDDVRFVRTAADLAAGAYRRWRAERELRHRSLHDVLTGLPNRALVISTLAAALPRADVGAPLVAIFIDLDGFKLVNDTLGHAAGDALLGEVATRLRREVRANDVVGRLAGDEFVVICEDTLPMAATEFAERLLEAIHLPFEGELDGASVGASIGVATARLGDTPERLLQRADAAMYRAKNAGRGQVALPFPDTAAADAPTAAGPPVPTEGAARTVEPAARRV